MDIMILMNLACGAKWPISVRLTTEMHAWRKVTLQISVHFNAFHL